MPVPCVTAMMLICSLRLLRRLTTGERANCNRARCKRLDKCFHFLLLKFRHQGGESATGALLLLPGANSLATGCKIVCYQVQAGAYYVRMS